MHVTRQGSGKPLLLVHGLGSNAHTWEPVLPALSEQREVIAVDLPGFGDTPPLAGEISIATLTDAVADYISDEQLTDVDLVGSSMGARIVLELARRGHGGTVVALDPGGFWNDRQLTVFAVSIRASFALVKKLQPALPVVTKNPVGRTALLAQFSAAPWRLPRDLVLAELRSIDQSGSLYPALDALVHGPRQEGATKGALRAKVVIGWGRHDRVTNAGQAATAQAKFPDATLHWFDKSGHFPHWDQPADTARLILDATS